MAWQTLYVTIGNSDDKLSQKRWAAYIEAVRVCLEEWQQHSWGEWFSAPDADRQNACWALEVEDKELEMIKTELWLIRHNFDQKSIAFATAEVHMIEEGDG